jgi:predicted secreted protein
LSRGYLIQSYITDIIMKVHTCFAFIIIVLFTSCSNSPLPSEPKLDSSINGKNLSYHSNQRFFLELDLSADAGYTWDYTVSDTNVVRIDSTIYRPKSGNWNQVGGLTIETFYFRTLRTGKSPIAMIEHQAWMPKVPPIDTLRFIVSVL